MNQKLITVGVVLALVLGIAGFFMGGKTIINTPAGAAVSSFFTENDYGYGGVALRSERVKLVGTAASTTVCVIPAPRTASSTVEKISYAATSATGTDMDLIIYKSVSAYLATTAITDRVVLSANTNMRVVATSSTLGNTIYAPGDVLVFRSTVAGGGNGVSSPTNGGCQASWILL